MIGDLKAALRVFRYARWLIANDHPVEDTLADLASLTFLRTPG